MTVNNWKYYVPLNSLLIGYSMQFFFMIIIITPIDFGIGSVLLVAPSIVFCAVESLFCSFFAMRLLFVSRSWYTLVLPAWQYSSVVVDYSSSYLISIVINHRAIEYKQNEEIINQLAFNTSVDFISFFTECFPSFSLCEWNVKQTLTLNRIDGAAENSWYALQIAVPNLWVRMRNTD